ncbi:hypothetical protein [Cryocola sp. 340MFSha3.1]|uniref:glycoside hydrolase family 38 N-terminal domain-containing protein n=1 Tax=Cryocola sp. 340MFSha3.1 TaxID=1169145 RepID=UPI00036C279F|nr:hypothetical protein [Cryocola sp. 340MFSha3.1]
MPRIRRLLLLGHTHHDVGYTNSPRIIDGMHAQIVREVLRLADQDTAAPDAPDRFRWTFEVARPVLEFLRTATPAEVARLRELAADGTIAVTGGYLNMTQLPDLAEFEAAYRSLQRIHDAGIPVRTEQHGDVNGIAWGVADAMLDAGIDRLVMALNPDHGRAPLEQPSLFWWEAPSGRRVLTLLSTHYGFGEEWGIVDGDVALAEQRILAFVERLDARDDYPFDTAVVHAGNDNRWPTALFTEVVRHWNDRHPGIPMETATIDTAMDALAAQAPDDLPVLRGEWADWWSHGHGSTAREVAVYREARRFAVSARAALDLARARGEGEPALATVLGYRRGPVRVRDDAELAATFDRVDEELLLFGEHTWGSWETYSKPHSHFSHSHWNAKAGFAYGAWDLARDLNVEALYRLAASGRDPEPADGVLVANLTDRPRREALEAEFGGTRRVTLVADVPASSVVVLPVPGKEPAATTGTTIEAGRFRATVDPERGGVVSLVDVRTGRELVDAHVPHGLGAVVAETVTAAGRSHAIFDNPKNFNPGFPGPEFARSHAASTSAPEVIETDAYARIRWSSELPGSLAATHTLTLYRDLDDIDLAVHIAKPEHFGPESLFVTFPFAVDRPEFLLETAGAVFAAESEQLPDTSKDWYSVQHAVGVRRAEGGPAVLWGTVDAPLVQLGGFHTGKWARTLDAPAGHINSWVMNNLHFTNFQARQEFTGTLHYRFRPVQTAEGSDAADLRAEVAAFGADLALPLQARSYTGPLGS